MVSGEHLQAMNSQICSKRMVQDELKRTQDCLLAAEKHFQKEMKHKDRTIQELEAEVRKRAANVNSPYRTYSEPSRCYFSGTNY